MRILGIDYGKKKIGLAVGDTEIHIASPFDVVRNDHLWLDAVKAIVQKEGIAELVVGMPQGTGHEIASYVKEVQDFADTLSRELNLPVLTYDESFTTAEAKRLMKDSKQKGVDDAIAAMVMLQGYLDSLD